MYRLYLFDNYFFNNCWVIMAYDYLSYYFDA